MITKNGVCYDLSKSPYKTQVDGLIFVFSSQLHKDKFKKKLSENRDIINYSLTKRFGFNVTVNQLADIVLYKKIETRGFLIETGGKVLCQKSLKYDGGKVMLEKLND